ncbi:hypothetical protein RB2083_1033 [Rhodobacteraceae bacterium HTCC2083]|nr:hypothetical protein RB2083_1033 [Rhodobacteraceae bacterium HTCC2083]
MIFAILVSLIYLFSLSNGTGLRLPVPFTSSRAPLKTHPGTAFIL